MDKNTSIEIIIGLYKKINEIKSKQIFIKEFEKDVENNLISLFPNIVQSLKKTNSNMEEWLVEIISCENVEKVKKVIEEMDDIEKELSSNTKDSSKEDLSYRIELLKNMFDNIIVNMNCLQEEIIKLEKDLIKVESK